MKLWHRASGALKDKNSLWRTGLGRRSKFRHPELESAVIRATSHDDRFVDYKNTQRVFAWVRTSPGSLLLFICALSRRLDRTRCWTVAVKGLMLFHGVLCTKLPATRKIGRLPFDLSSFDDTYSPRSHRWAFNSFVRAYFQFLDHKSGSLCTTTSSLSSSASANNSNNNNDDDDNPKNDFDQKRRIRIRISRDEPIIAVRLSGVKKLQDMLDLLLEIQPKGRGIGEAVIMEAMDCVIIEVFDVYSKICDGIANVLIRIYAAAAESTKESEAVAALEILQRARRQGDELEDYFVLCREIGLLNSSECPKVERISDEDVRELKKIISDSNNYYNKSMALAEKDKEDEDRPQPNTTKTELGGGRDHYSSWFGDRVMKTIITDKWEVFDDDGHDDHFHLEDDRQKAKTTTMVEVGDLIDLSEDITDYYSYNLYDHHHTNTDPQSQTSCCDAADMAIVPAVYNYNDAGYHKQLEGNRGQS